MSFPSQFRRIGSILVPFNLPVRRTAAPVTPAEPLSPRTARRKGFSEHHALSLYSSQVCLNNRLEEALFAWAETEPLVVDVQVVNLVISYKIEGKTRTTKLPLKVALRSGSVVYWDCVSAEGGNSRGVNAKQEFAEAAGAGYRLMPWKFFAERRHELRGRLGLQNVLHSGQVIDTTGIESQAMLRLVDGPRTISELAAVVGASDLAMQVAAARLWRAGRVQLPIAESPLNMRWLVSLGVTHEDQL
ncbi:hypothetical protein [Pelomonas sp. KK5]|uniref:hypothetical protein n=1 Tax=Pelomonas sp. KK5 TaxID=1855730 RepID=UPI00097CAA59|nr:hypothetical protein [Pelomonas sp. KK5]